MNTFNQLIERFFPSPQAIPPGTYHYQAPKDADFPYRLHLRVEAGGQSTLIVNASTVLHLNQTATDYAFHLVQQTPMDEVIREVKKRYKVTTDQVQMDYQDLIDRLFTLIETPDLDPITFLDFERQTPYTGNLSAPYRLDCAITYKINDPGDQLSAPVDRVERELSTEEWKTILLKAWNVGIPHIVFTGGEPTLRDDLVTMIEHSEELGQVTGLLTDGLKFIDKDYLNSLLQSGLDHIMITLDAENEASWQVVKNALDEDIHVVVHMTLTPENSKQVVQNLKRLTEMEAYAVSLSVSDEGLNKHLQAARQIAADLGLSLVWDLPVPYSVNSPVALELADNDKEVEGAGNAWLYVEPDGDVLAEQGRPEVLGNMLNDPWDQIWKQE